MTVSAPIGDSFNSVGPYLGRGQTWTQPTTTSTKKTVTTVREYDEDGRVTKETVTEVTESTTPNYNPYITWNGDTYTASSGTHTASADAFASNHEN
jgi:hypothetical protein